MRGVKTRNTTAQLIGQAIIATLRSLNKWPIMDRDETSKAVAEIWDEVEGYDTYGKPNVAWVYEIRQAAIIGNSDTLFKQVLRYVQERRITA